MAMPDCIDHGKRGTGKGYAQRSVQNRGRYMHRLAYARAHGLDEATMGGVVMHSCDNPRCINPDHLSLGTYADNTADMVRKGRNKPPRGAANGNSKLTPEQVAEILATSGTQREIGLRYGVGQDQISRIRGGKRWQN